MERNQRSAIMDVHCKLFLQVCIRFELQRQIDCSSFGFRRQPPGYQLSDSARLLLDILETSYRLTEAVTHDLWLQQQVQSHTGWSICFGADSVLCYVLVVPSYLQRSSERYAAGYCSSNRRYQACVLEIPWWEQPCGFSLNHFDYLYIDRLLFIGSQL